MASAELRMQTNPSQLLLLARGHLTGTEEAAKAPGGGGDVNSPSVAHVLGGQAKPLLTQSSQKLSNTHPG